MFRTSEFWVAIATAIGAVLTGMKVLPEEEWTKIVYPALIYIIARLTSKFVKKVF